VEPEDEEPAGESSEEEPAAKAAPRDSRGHRARSRTRSISSSSSSSSSSAGSSSKSSISRTKSRRHKKRRHSGGKHGPVTKPPPAIGHQADVKTAAFVPHPHATYPPVGPANTAHTQGNPQLGGPVTLAGELKGHSVPLQTMPLIPPVHTQPVDTQLPANIFANSPAVTTASSAAQQTQSGFQ
jgi:hypothetical protein